MYTFLPMNDYYDTVFKTNPFLNNDTEIPSYVASNPFISTVTFLHFFDSAVITTICYGVSLIYHKKAEKKIQETFIVLSSATKTVQSQMKKLIFLQVRHMNIANLKIEL